MKDEFLAIAALFLLYGGLPLIMAYLLNRFHNGHKGKTDTIDSHDCEYMPETDADAWARPERTCVLCRQLVAHTKHVRQRRST